ncbi:MAG: hypothetical protein ACOYJ2_00445 [Rickettsiales bacterium]
MPTRLQNIIGPITTHEPNSTPVAQSTIDVVTPVINFATLGANQTITSAGNGDIPGSAANGAATVYNGANAANTVRAFGATGTIAAEGFSFSGLLESALNPLGLIAFGSLAYYNMGANEHYKHQAGIQRIDEVLAQHPEAVRYMASLVPALDSSHHLSDPRLDSIAHTRHALSRYGDSYTHEWWPPHMGEGYYAPIVEQGSRSRDMNHAIAQYFLDNPEDLVVAEAELGAAQEASRLAAYRPRIPGQPYERF